MKKDQPRALKSAGFSSRDIAAVLFRRKWLVVTTLLTSVVVAAVFASLAPDMYESRMKFLVRNMRTDAPLSAGNDKVADKMEVSEEQITSEMELLKSRDLLERVVRQVNLAEPSAEGAELNEKDIERAVYKLEKDLQVTAVKKANIIEVSYSSKEPETAAAVLTLLSELYLDKHLKLHRPPGAYEFFKTQADQYERDLRRAENDFSAFQQRENAVGIDRQKELTLVKLMDAKAKLKDLNGTIAETDKRIATLESQLEKMEKRVTTQSRVVPNQYSAERLNTMLIELRNRRTQLLTKFQPTDRVVRELDEQIATTSEALDKANRSTSVEQSSDVNPIRQSIEGELSRARADQSGRLALRKNLTEQVAQYEGQLTKLEKATSRHDDLSRQVKQTEETFQLYAKKQEESRIADALDQQKISNVSIAEAPIVPRTPNKNNRLLGLVLGLGLGIGLCFGSLFVTELLRDTFLTPGELESFAGIPVLATMPFDEKIRQTLNEAENADFTDETISDYSEEEEELETDYADIFPPPANGVRYKPV